MCTKILSPECINAIQQFQINIKEKECYLAFYVRSKISMSFDAMTTSPVESMNSSLKRGTGINKNSNTRYVNVRMKFESINTFLMCTLMKNNPLSQQ
jgi:hypothetical protein